MTYSGIEHDRLGGCGDGTVKCTICTGAHKSKNYKCGITSYITKKGKIGVHVVPKFANCGGNHQATIFRCPAKRKTQSEA